MRLFCATLLAFSLLAATGCSKSGAATAVGAVTQQPSRLDIRYLHRTVRCPSCMRIEMLARQAVEQAFAGELSSGRVTWQAVNLDLPENEHFNSDYKLQAQSVVLSDMHGGKEGRWKNLEKVWDLLDQEDAFTAYVQSEAAGWLKD